MDFLCFKIRKFYKNINNIFKINYRDNENFDVESEIK